MSFTFSTPVPRSTGYCPLDFTGVTTPIWPGVVEGPLSVQTDVGVPRAAKRSGLTTVSEGPPPSKEVSVVGPRVRGLPASFKPCLVHLHPRVRPRLPWSGGFRSDGGLEVGGCLTTYSPTGLTHTHLMRLSDDVVKVLPPLARDRRDLLVHRLLLEFRKESYL